MSITFKTYPLYALSLGLLTQGGLASALIVSTRDDVPVVKTRNGTYYGSMSAICLIDVNSLFRFARFSVFGRYFLPAKRTGLTFFGVIHILYHLLISEISR